MLLTRICPAIAGHMHNINSIINEIKNMFLKISIKPLILIFLSSIFIIVFNGCATTQSIKLKEIKYEYFKEYNAVLPTIYNSKENRIEVRLDWLFNENSDTNILPATNEAAERLVNIKKNQIKEKRITERIRKLGEYPFLGLVILTFPISMPILFYFFEQKPVDIQREKEKNFLENNAGVNMKITVLNENNVPIKNAQIVKIVSPKNQSTYLDSKTGLRLINEKQIQYHFSQQKIELLTSCLPIDSERYPFINNKTNSKGEVELLLDDYLTYASYKDKEYYWDEEIKGKDFYFIAWAPGYDPNFVSIKANPLDSVNAQIILTKNLNFENISKLYSDFELLKSNYSKVSDFGKFMSRNKVDKEIFYDTLGQLEKWITDENLPSPFRYKCLKTYSSIEKDFLRYLGNRNKYSIYLSDKVKSFSIYSDLSTYYSDNDLNPWKFDKEIWSLKENDYSSKDIYELYEKGIKIDANNPEVENLLFYYYIKENDMKEALKHSKFISNWSYFKYVYGYKLVN